MTEQELRRDVKGYEGIYEVDVLGNIYNKSKNVKLKQCVDKFGYSKVSLRNNGKQKQKKVHRAVAESFILNPLSKPQVNHIDGDKSNNCVWNLEWCDNSQNMHHAYELGLANGTKVRIVETGEVFNTIFQCAKHINGSDANIHRCLRGDCETHKGYHFERVVE